MKRNDIIVDTFTQKREHCRYFYSQKNEEELLDIVRDNFNKNLSVQITWTSWETKEYDKLF